MSKQIDRRPSKIEVATLQVGREAYYPGVSTNMTPGTDFRLAFFSLTSLQIFGFSSLDSTDHCQSPSHFFIFFTISSRNLYPVTLKVSLPSSFINFCAFASPPFCTTYIAELCTTTARDVPATTRSLHHGSTTVATPPAMSFSCADGSFEFLVLRTI